MLGGVISYASTNYNGSDYGEPHVGYNFQVKPNVGYFIADKFAIGITTLINSSGVKPTGTTGYNKLTDFNIGPFVRYYLLPTDNRTNILTETTYQIGYEKRNQNDPALKNTFILAAGPVFYFNSSVGLEMQINYSLNKFKEFTGINHAIMFGLGLQIHFESKQ
jgi:hypothetical protein